MSINVRLITITGETWASWPEDRAFSELAKDALAMERLMAKEVDPRTQHVRYTQLCCRLQTLAIQYIRSTRNTYDSISWEGNKAKIYLQLLKSLQQLEQQGKFAAYLQCNEAKDTYIPRKQNIFGQCFYQPGIDISIQSNIFSSIKLDREKALDIAYEKGGFYRNAFEQSAAVIEIVSFY